MLRLAIYTILVTKLLRELTGAQLKIVYHIVGHALTYVAIRTILTIITLFKIAMIIQIHNLLTYL